MHVWTIIAFVLFLTATVVSVVFKQWTVGLIAAGLAAELVPAVAHS
jgi:hypothetical protein